MADMFKNSTSLAAITFDSSFDTSKVTSMESMFENSGITGLDLSVFDTSAVTNMTSMFKTTPSLDSLTLDASFDTSKVETMDSMFESTNLDSVDLTLFDTTSALTFDSMFKGSSVDSVDLSLFETDALRHASNMLSNMNDLTSVNLSVFDLDTVNSVENMLSGSNNLATINLGTWSGGTEPDSSYTATGMLPTSVTVSNSNTIIHCLDNSRQVTIDSVTYSCVPITCSGNATYNDPGEAGGTATVNLNLTFGGSNSTIECEDKTNDAIITCTSGGTFSVLAHCP
jgi:surface protein